MHPVVVRVQGIHLHAGNGRARWTPPCSSTHCLCWHLARFGERNAFELPLQPRDYAQGRVIYEQGDPATYVYWLCEGQVELVHHRRSGQRSVLRFVEPGEFFGLEPLAGCRRYFRGAYARQASRILPLDPQAVQLKLLEDAQVSFVILQAMAGELVATEERLSTLLVNEALTRVAQTLWQLLQPHANGNGGGSPAGVEAEGSPEDPPCLPLTNEELAALTGVSPQTVSMCLCKLRSQGIISRQRGQIVVLDLWALERLAARK